MKLIIDIPEEVYKHGTLGLYFDCYSMKLHDTILNGTPIPDTDTNGNSVIKIFCKGIVRINSRKNVSVEFNKDWWKEPYQKGGK